MQNLLIIIGIVVMSWFVEGKAQELNVPATSVLTQRLETAQSAKDLQILSQQFEEIATANPENELAAYYALLTKTLRAFHLNPKTAIALSTDLDKELESWESTKIARAERLVLRGLIRTIKLAKSPEVYGMTLPSAILADYNEALKLAPENPRALYLVAQLNMEAAPFWGKEPVQYCPDLKKALQQFEAENLNKPNIHWGEIKAQKIWEEKCSAVESFKPN